MKKYLLATLASFISFGLFSSLAYAQVSFTDVNTGIGTLGSLINNFNQSVVRAVAVLFLSAAVVIFFLGIVQYIWGLRAGDSGKAKNGSNFMLWGLVALFVMFSVYGIITFAQSVLLGGANTSSIVIPDIRINGSTGTGASGAGTGGTSPLGYSCTPLGSCTMPNGLAGRCSSTGTVCEPIP